LKRTVKSANRAVADKPFSFTVTIEPIQLPEIKRIAEYPKVSESQLVDNAVGTLIRDWKHRQPLLRKMATLQRLRNNVATQIQALDNKIGG
jgi:hypothetical protein